MGNCFCCRREEDEYIFDEPLPSGSWLRTPDTVSFPSSTHMRFSLTGLSSDFDYPYLAKRDNEGGNACRGGSGTPKNESSVKTTAPETSKTGKHDAVIEIPKGDVYCIATQHDRGAVINRVEVGNTSVDKDGTSSGSVEINNKDETDGPYEKIRNVLNNTSVGKSDLSSSDMEVVNKDDNGSLVATAKLNFGYTSSDEAGFSVSEVQIVNNAGNKGFLEKEVEKCTSAMENTEKYDANNIDERDFRERNSQTRGSVEDPFGKTELETNLKENSSSKETGDGKVTTKLDEVDSYEKNGKSPAKTTFEKSKSFAANSRGASLTVMEIDVQLEPTVCDGTNAQTWSKNTEFGEENGSVSVKSTSTDNKIELVATECVVKEDDSKNPKKENISLEDFVGETTSETSHDEKFYQSIAEIEAEKKTKIVSGAIEHVQTSSTRGETSSFTENDAGEHTQNQDVYSLKESCGEVDT